MAILNQPREFPVIQLEVRAFWYGDTLDGKVKMSASVYGA